MGRGLLQPHSYVLFRHNQLYNQQSSDIQEEKDLHLIIYF
jgi:hypothetical protein